MIRLPQLSCPHPTQPYRHLLPLPSRPCSWSCLEPAQERHLQDHAFVLPAHGVRYGTRELAFTVCVRQATFFVYRGFAADGGSPSAQAPAAADLVCADAHPGAGAGETVMIDGQDWLIVRA